MSTQMKAVGSPAAVRERPPVVNDFSIQVATVNGSGSQSSNNILMRSIFRMGVPVSGKNIFPSNIAGLPTWFTIRANKDGWVARKKEIDVLVLMNPDTVSDDIKDAIPGAAVIYNDSFEKLNLIPKRDDVVVYPVPFDPLVAEICPNAKLRKLVVNMIYVGVVARLLDIDEAVVEGETRKMFGKKVKALEINLAALRAGFRYVDEHLPKQDPYRIERMSETDGKIIIDGNSAAAIGAVFAGCTVFAWYPITPSSTLGEAFTEYAGRYRRDPKTGKAHYAIVQAEDELAALGMAVGAGWAGCRAMTATSGPGISLMTEFTGLAYYTEVPVVIVDVQRVGPSTGLPTRTAQGDILKIAFLSHGDTGHPILFPASVAEAYAMVGQAFDLAERLQTPVFVAMDLDLGMNNWMSDPFPYPTKPFDRGKVLTAPDIEKLVQAGKTWGRYKDTDGDGIPYRTLPGTPHPAAGYFTRGSGHDEYARYTEKPDAYKAMVDRLKRKQETARKLVPAPVITRSAAGAGAGIGIIAYGSTDPAVPESMDQLVREAGIRSTYLRVRAIPFDRQILTPFLAEHEHVYVVEQNRDGQLGQILKMEFPEHATRFRPVLHYTGIPIDARFVTQEIRKQEGR